MNRYFVQARLFINGALHGSVTFDAVNCVCQIVWEDDDDVFLLHENQWYWPLYTLPLLGRVADAYMQHLDPEHVPAELRVLALISN